MPTTSINQDNHCFFCGSLKRLMASISARMKTYIHNPEDVYAFLKKRGYLRRRNMLIIFLDQNRAVIGVKRLRLSAIRSFRTYRKNIMDPCAELKAFQVIVAHTQPSRNPALSVMDNQTGTFVIQQGLLTGHRTFDYVIAAQKGYMSFREEEPSKWGWTLPVCKA